MVETLFVLFLTFGGEAKEWTPHFKLTECLSVKRKIDRNVGTGHLYSCKKEKVALKQEGAKYIIIDFVEE